MRAVIQRVNKASVQVESQVVGQINKGMLILIAVAHTDTKIQADWLVKKLIDLRIFDDAQGKMNLSALEIKAEFLIVSQFTLYGNCDKGRRPSFDEAAEPKLAEELYNYFVEELKKTKATVATGVFRAMMGVSLVNDGPVTFILESSDK